MSAAQEAQSAALQKARQRLEKLTWLLDDSFTLPGTKHRFGLDPIIGLIPGVGDVVGAGLSLYIIIEAARLGAPRRLLVRMVGNALLEATVGVIPVAGDLFDFYWKANSRNRHLLEAHIDKQLQPTAPETSPWVPVLLVTIVLLLILLLLKSLGV